MTESTDTVKNVAKQAPGEASKLALRRILVPVDFSETSRLAVQTAMQLGAHFGASIDLLHVWEPPQLRPDLMVWAEADGKTLWDVAKRNAAEELGTFLSSLPAKSIARHEIRTGNPAELIVERARDGGYDLLVLGTHGRTGVQHFFIGSVAEKVVRLAPCPVLTVRTPKPG